MAEIARFVCPNCSGWFESGEIGVSVTLGEENRQRCLDCNKVVVFVATEAPTQFKRHDNGRLKKCVSCKGFIPLDSPFDKFCKKSCVLQVSNQ